MHFAKPVHANTDHLGYNWLQLALTQAVTFSISNWVVSGKPTKLLHSSEENWIGKEGNRKQASYFPCQTGSEEATTLAIFPSSNSVRCQGEREH